MEKKFVIPMLGHRRRKMQGSGALLLSAMLLSTVSGCATPSGGPSTRAMNNAANERQLTDAPIKIVDVDETIAQRLSASSRLTLFSEGFGDGRPVGTVVGRGDVLDISIWEAPPAALFGAAGGDARMVTTSTSVARGTTLPEQMVDANGQITLPFVGTIQADGKTLQQIGRAIGARLAGKAHDPQVIVRLAQNAAANVTIVGDVNGAARMPLTAKGERLLDALAAAGGVRQAVGKMTLQITREGKVLSLPLETIIRDPRQNIRLQANDVVTALFQPFSFTALGAAGTNSEVLFEGTGLSLAQALGRIGGLQDSRADAKGVFIFRFEDPAALNLTASDKHPTATNGKVPVIYRVNMKNPSTLFVAQSFPIHNGDVVYVSNAPLADLQKFVNVAASLAYPLISLQNALDNNN